MRFSPTASQSTVDSPSSLPPASPASPSRLSSVVARIKSDLATHQQPERIVVGADCDRLESELAQALADARVRCAAAHAQMEAEQRAAAAFAAAHDASDPEQCHVKELVHHSSFGNNEQNNGTQHGEKHEEKHRHTHHWKLRDIFSSSPASKQPQDECPLAKAISCKDFPASIGTPTYAELSFFKRALLVYNPFSGNRTGDKKMRKANVLLAKKRMEVHNLQLLRPGHCEEVCRATNLDPFDVLIVVGGDGTFHEAVNGLMNRTDGKGSKIPLAMIPAGTGNSFALEVQRGTSVRNACDLIRAGLHVPIDVCKLTFPKEDGPSEVIWSFNSIHWGLASKVLVTAEKLRWMGKAIRYTTAALLELMHGERARVKILMEEADGKRSEIDDYFTLIIANNIRSTAKGMQMVPRAVINDGLVDLLMIKTGSAKDLVRIFMKVYDGTHTELPSVVYKQVRRFAVLPLKSVQVPTGKGGKVTVTHVEQEVDPDVAEELIDIDGELKGSTPFVCEVFQHALRVVV